MHPWHKPSALDVVAVVTLTICGIGMFKGLPGDFYSPILLIVGYYFGKRSSGNPYDNNPKT